jgi:hypothetical protein
MKEQIIRRNIMEAAQADGNKTVCAQLTFHGYTAEETKEIEAEMERFWGKIKEQLQLTDLPEKEVEEAVLKRY